MTLKEWWAAYCLRFGPKQLRQPFVDGEQEFMQQIIAEHFADAPSTYAEGRVITAFSVVQFEIEQKKEDRAGQQA